MIDVKSLKVGDRVKSCLSGYYVEQDDWYEGEVASVRQNYMGGHTIVDVYRDDESEGTGKDGSWNTLVDDNNKTWMSLLLGDWDE